MSNVEARVFKPNEKAPANIVGVANITIKDAIAIPSVSIVRADGKDGSYIFASLPQRCVKGKWENIVNVSETLRKEINAAVRKEFDDQKALDFPGYKNANRSEKRATPDIAVNANVFVLRNENSNIKGIAKFTIDQDITVNNCTVMSYNDPSKGLFVNMPHVTDKDGNAVQTKNGDRIDVVMPVTAEARALIVNAILSDYDKNKDRTFTKDDFKSKIADEKAGDAKAAGDAPEKPEKDAKAKKDGDRAA